MRRYIVLAVGKPKESWQKQAILEYEKRLGAFTKVDTQELSEGHAGAKKPDIHKTRTAESKAMLATLPKDSFIIALDETGKNLSSEDFAKRIEKESENGRSITFLIGGSWGLLEDIHRRADLVLSFGKETLPHILARIVLLEQVYRAETILKGKTYHK